MVRSHRSAVTVTVLRAPVGLPNIMLLPVSLNVAKFQTQQVVGTNFRLLLQRGSP
jgi:hypothetical protein